MAYFSDSLSRDCLINSLEGSRLCIFGGENADKETPSPCLPALGA
jgi:hypothetical protein